MSFQPFTAPALRRHMSRALRATLAPFLVLLSLAGAAHAQTFRLDQPLPDDRDTILHEVVVGTDQTTVVILLINTGSEPFGACAQASGRPEAFSLKDLDSGQVWHQVRTAGLRGCDDGLDPIEPGGHKALEIFFPRLPASVRRVQIGENSCRPDPEGDLNFWCFPEVVLTRKP